MDDESGHGAAGLVRDLRRALDGEPPPSPAARAWFDARGDDVLAALRDPDAESAADLLDALWPVVPLDASGTWAEEVHRLGADLSAALPTSPVLTSAFRRGAAWFRARGDHRLATAQGVFELAVHRERDDDPDAVADALADLAVTYREQGLLHEVADCLDEALETYQRHGRADGVARTLLALGTLMLEAGRPGVATDHLARADRAFEDAPDPVRHAECLALLGWAWQRSGEEVAAHRAHNRALALAMKLDDGAARRVRDLVAQPPSLAEEGGQHHLDEGAGEEAEPRREP
ncbi:hypothetical protein [Saccharothrix sp. Mg75]|uniref:hypothetical protein n=1 Tax=Saccharothrix sp. Mg75 TaxID=3445357 RepID=UPI003EEDC014